MRVSCGARQLRCGGVAVWGSHDGGSCSERELMYGGVAICENCGVYELG